MSCGARRRRRSRPTIGIEPSAPALPVRPGHERAVEHDAAADERAEEEIEEVAMTPRLAEEEFGRAGRGRVVAERDADRSRQPRSPRSMSKSPPGVHRALAARRSPPPRSRAGTAMATPRPAMRRRCRIARAHRPAKAATLGRNRESSSGVGKAKVRCARSRIAPAEIDQHEIAAAPPDLQAEREGALGIERHRDGRLTDAAAQRRLALQEPVGLQPIHDRRGRLHRQVRSAARPRSSTAGRSGAPATAAAARCRARTPA